MASTYVNDLRLNEMATGDQSGSWGTVTNLNLELIGEAFSFGTEAITTNADTHTTTIADGATDAGRSMFLKYTGTLDSACTITIGPNTVSKMWFIENATSGSQNIIISQGSGANVTIAAGETKAVYSDGAGAGAAFVDAFAALNVAGVSPTELAILDGLTATTAELNIMDGVTATTAELNYNDITTLGTVQASKVVTAAASGDVLWPDNEKANFGNSADLRIYHDGSNSNIRDAGTGFLGLDTEGGSDVRITSGGSSKVMGYFAKDGEVRLYYDGNGKLATTSSGIDVTGTVTTGGTVISDGSITDTGDFTLDVAGDITLDADGGDIRFKDAGTEFLQIFNNSTDAHIYNPVQDKDILIQGNDGGSTVTALTLDMSDAGTATFNHDAKFSDNGKAIFGAGSDLQIYHDGSNSWIKDAGTGNLVLAATNFYVNNAADSQNMITAIDGAEVLLKYAGNTKLATTSGGITVTGSINSGDLRGNVSLIGPDTNDYIQVASTSIVFALDGAVDMQLYNSGDLHVEGNVIAYSTTISDERLKTDIVKIDGALDKVAQLNGYTFTYTADGKKSAGVIAQEVQKVLPSAIVESKLPLKMGDDDETEYMTVQYDQLMGLMVEAIKELKAEVAELKGK